MKIEEYYKKWFPDVGFEKAGGTQQISLASLLHYILTNGKPPDFRRLVPNASDITDISSHNTDNGQLEGEFSLNTLQINAKHHEAPGHEAEGIYYDSNVVLERGQTKDNIKEKNPR